MPRDEINRDAKLDVVHPSRHRMEFLSNYMSFRSACVDNLKQQIFSEREVSGNAFSHSSTSKDAKAEANILNMLKEINTKNMLSLVGLWNFLENKEATPEQAYDLLNCRRIGQEAFEKFVLYKIIGTPSTGAPNRRKRLTIFSISKVQKQRVKLVEKERKISQRYLKQQQTWISEQGASGFDFENLLGPISSLPRALISKDGLPYKSTKANTMEFLRKRYSCIVTENLPSQWAPHTAVLEGMFIIQSSPLPSMGCMREYSKWLLDQHVRPHLRAGAKEVHVVFDSPGSMRESPKELEQRRRDSNADDTHKCTEISSTSAVPNKWRGLLGCRKCKQLLTQYLAQEMLSLAPNILNNMQTFVSNVGKTAHSVTSTGEVLPFPQLWSNADEGDLRVWLHCIHSAGTQKLLFSPDTDVYHIGLTILPLLPRANITVQLTQSYNEGSKFLLLHQLHDALLNDPDLHGIHPELRLQALQSLYVCSGCDYVSFFAELGKISFLSTFFSVCCIYCRGLRCPRKHRQC